MLLRPPVRQLALLLSCQFGAARRLPGTGCASLRFVTAAAAIRAAVPVPAPVLSINPKLDATLPYRALAFSLLTEVFTEVIFIVRVTRSTPSNHHLKRVRLSTVFLIELREPAEESCRTGRSPECPCPASQPHSAVG